MPAPITASGMISQLAQPSSGMKAIARENQRDDADDEGDEVEHGVDPSIIGRLRQPAAARSERGHIERQRGPDRGEGDRVGAA